MDEIPAWSRSIIEALASQAAGAIARIRAEQALLEIADREQARIGQDIHDGLCQDLVTLAFDANALQNALARREDLEAVRARRIAGLLDTAITESRRLARGLFPVRLETDGLPPALEELAGAVGTRFNIQCRFENRGHVTVQNSAVATHLYRIAQEAVNNAVRHGKPRRVLIQLRERRDQIELRISDDGQGSLPRAREQSNGMGLHIMNYRARTLGGALRLITRPRRGTVVCCCIPRPALQ